MDRSEDYRDKDGMGEVVGKAPGVGHPLFYAHGLISRFAAQRWKQDKKAWSSKLKASFQL